MLIRKKNILTIICIAVTLSMITPTVFSNSLDNNSEKNEISFEDTYKKLSVSATSTDLSNDESMIQSLNLDFDIPDDWWNESWPFRKKIVIEKENIPKNFTNFSVLINIESDNDLKHRCQEKGYDIVFKDEEKTKLYHEIEEFDNSTGRLVTWVKTDLKKDKDNVLYLYYGNPDCLNQENKTMVWDEQYILVHHLSEKNNTLYDSTIYENNGIYLNYDDSFAVEGKIAGAVSFNGTNFNCGNNSVLDLTNQMTLQTWVNYSKKDNISTLIEKTNSYSLLVNSSGNIIFNGSINDENVFVTFNVTLEENKWTYLVLTYQNTSDSEFKLYIDGELKETNNSFQGLINPSDKDLLFANNQVLDSGLNGSLDEIRILNAVIDSEWIKTEFFNMNNSADFYNIGSEKSLKNIYQVSTLFENATNPTVAVDKDGNLFAAYDSDKDDNIKWVFSSDNGKTWNVAFDYEVDKGIPSRPVTDYWDHSRFYSTFTPPSEDKYGAVLHLIEHNINGRTRTSVFDWSTHKLFPDVEPAWYDFKDIDISCDSSQRPHQFGVISLVASTNVSVGPVENGPHIFYIPADDPGAGSFVWEPKYSNCANSSIDIDSRTHRSYSVYEWFNNSRSKLILMLFDFANPPTGDIGYNDILEIEEDFDLYHPSVAAYNDNIVIVSEIVNSEGNRSIICKYSSDGFDTETFETSYVVDSSNDETNPVVEWVKANTFVCTFYKDGNLYISESNDGGETWSEGIKLNDVDGTVVKDYNGYDISNSGRKIVWSDNRDEDNIKVFIADTGIEIPLEPASLRIVGFNGGFGLSTTIDNTGEETARNINWKIIIDGKNIFFNDNYFELGGKINSLGGGHITLLENQVFWGFGPVSFVATLDAENAELVSYSRSAFLIGPFIWFNRPQVRVSGTIFDKDTNEEIGFAQIKAESDNGILSRTFRERTNIFFDKGSYELYLEPGNYNITVKRFDYIQETKTIEVRNGFVMDNLDFFLESKKIIKL